MRLPSCLRRRPSAALVVSCVALFISLGGASYAAITIPNNSVGAAQLQKNAVTNSKLENNAVSYKKIQAGSVGSGCDGESSPPERDQRVVSAVSRVRSSASATASS